MNAVPYTDELVREYLLFRGFTDTLRQFDADRRKDKTKAFVVDKILAQLHEYVVTYDLANLLSLWEFLDAKFFSRLDGAFSSASAKLELSLHRHFLVNAMLNGRPDIVVAFFDSRSAELLKAKPEWRDWFALPYTRSPETDPVFRTFFTKAWVDSFSVSLANFLGTVFQSMPLPALLNFNTDRLRRTTAEAQVKALRAELRRVTKGETLPHFSGLTAESVSVVGGSAAGPTRNVATQAPEVASRAPSPIPGEDDEMGEPTSGRSVDAALAALHDSREPAPSIADEIVLEPFVVLSQEVYSEHSGPVTACEFSANGALIASTSTDRTVRLWTFSSFDTSKNTFLRLEAPALSLAWEPRSDKLLLCGTSNHRVKVFDAQNRSMVGEATSSASFPHVVSVRCSPSDRVVAAATTKTKSSVPTLYSYYDEGDASGEVRLFDLKTLQHKNSLPQQSAAPVTCMEYNHNGTLLVTGSTDGHVRVFDTVSLDCVAGWEAHSGPVDSVTFSEDETRILSIGGEGKFAQWSLRNTNQELFTHHLPELEGEEAIRGKGIALDATGKYALVGTGGGFASVFRLDLAEPVQQLGGHTEPVVCVDWHPTLNCTLTGSLDSKVRVSKLVSELE